MTHIFEWKCSYYSYYDRTWKYGKLKLYQHELKFKADSKDKQLIRTNLSDINEVKRRTTNLLFNAIRITDVYKQVFWFSSFDNVYNVLSIIQHFWKGLVLGNEGAKSSRMQTTPRNELLEIAYDSQNTLMTAGRTLHAQGEQINEASKKMDMLHADLRIGEHLVSDLNSWFGDWGVKSPEIAPFSGRKESPVASQRLEYAVLIAKTIQESHTSAVLVIGNKNIEIFDGKNKLLYSFPIAELSYASVHSPYDMTLEKRLIGKPDVKVHVIATRLPFILQTFESVYRYKPIYEDLPTSSDDESRPSAESQKKSGFERNVVEPALQCFQDRKIKSAGSGAFAEKSDSDRNWITGKELQHQQVKSKSKQMTESDANELSSVLRSMKAMAIDIQSEQELQNDQIDRLTQSVQSADAKVREDNRTIKKML